MKKTNLTVLLNLTALLFWSGSAFGQSFAVFFANRLSASVFAPVSHSDGTPLYGSGYSAQLYAGTNTSGLVAVGTPQHFRTGAGAGSWAGVNVAIPWTISGWNDVTLQVRVWDNNGGVVTSYEAAYAAGRETGVSGPFRSLDLTGGFPPGASYVTVGNSQAAYNLQPFATCPPPCDPSPVTVRLATPKVEFPGFFDFSALPSRSSSSNFYQIEYSTNLVTWSALWSLTAEEAFVFGGGSLTSSPQMFFRVR